MIVSSGLLNANIDDANVHVEYVEENFSRAFASLEKFAVETESLGRLSKIKNYPNSKTLRTNRKFPPFQRRINKIVKGRIHESWSGEASLYKLCGKRVYHAADLSEMGRVS